MNVFPARWPRRPAFWAGVVLAAGTICGAHPDGRLVLLGGTVLWALLVVARRAVRSGLLSIAPLLLLAWIGYGRLAYTDQLRPACDLRFLPQTAASLRLFGRIEVEPDRRPRYTAVTLSADSVDYGDSVRVRRGNVLVRLDRSIVVRYGDYLVLRGHLQRPAGVRNPGAFDYAAYLARRDIHVQLIPAPGNAVEQRLRTHTDDWLGRVVIPSRLWIRNHLSLHLSGEQLALVLGLLFGERTILSAETLERFQITGTLHLLAVSGSNVAVVIAVVWGLLAFLRVPRRSRTVVSLLALVLFCWLSHNQPSVVRAAVAATLVLLGRMQHRTTDPVNIWGGSLLLLLLYNPQQLFDAGFQLSFAATLGIILFAPLLGRYPAGRAWWKRGVRYLVMVSGASVAAQVAVTPILAWVFNQVPLVTPLSNVVCVPAAGLATAAGLFTILLAPLGGVCGALLAGSTWLFTTLLLRAVEFFAALGFGVWNPSTPALVHLAAYYILLGFFYLGLARAYWRRRILLGALIIVNSLLLHALFRPPPPLTIAILDSGTAGLSAVRWPDQSVWIVGQGRPGYFDPVAGVMSPYLHRFGWANPSHVWLLDRVLDPDRMPRLWPRPDVLPPPGIGSRPAADRSGTFYHTTLYTARASTRPLALRLRAPAWDFIWLKSAALLPFFVPTGQRTTWVAVPRLPWNAEDLLRGHPGLVLLEACVPGERPRNDPGGENVRKLRTVTQGGIVTLEKAGTLQAETSRR